MDTICTLYSCTLYSQIRCSGLLSDPPVRLYIHIPVLYTVPLQYLYLETEQSDHTGWPIIPRTNDDFFLLEIL